MARKLKGQISLFAEHEEASKLIRAADDLRNTKARTVKYKHGGYGVKIKSAVLTDKLGKEEAAKTITKDKESMLDELLGVVT